MWKKEEVEGMRKVAGLITGGTVALSLLASCGGGAGGGTSGSDVLRGTLLAPDGKTPVAGATVYVPGASSVSGFSIASSGCEEPPEPYTVYTCTGPDGSFTLDVSLLSGTITLKFKKGSFQKTLTINLGFSAGSLGNVTLPSNPDQGAPRMAVVTGSYDRMEDILAKLGFGSLNPWGQLELGTETFDLYDGNYSLPDAEYRDFPEIFNDNDGDSKPDIYNYDIVFINCGNSYEYLLNDPDKVNILRDYVFSGGKLYVTDWSYDFVEQVFPEYIDFWGSDLTPETDPENMQEAQVGDGGISTNAEVLDSTLRDWLKVVSCVDSLGNPVDCIDPATERVHIEGFLSQWAVMNGAHASKAGDVKFWVRGNVSWYGGSGVKPLTVTFKHGAGKVLYTSYHTEASYLSGAGLLPQERILQYLVFF